MSPVAPLVIRSAAPQERSASGIEVQWARHQDEVRAAQRLRFDVFAGEMGAILSNAVPGHDVDLFDDFCEHLLVRDNLSDAVIGTYRVLMPAQAARVGRRGRVRAGMTHYRPPIPKLDTAL